MGAPTSSAPSPNPLEAAARAVQGIGESLAGALARLPFLPGRPAESGRDGGGAPSSVAAGVATWPGDGGAARSGTSAHRAHHGGRVAWQRVTPASAVAASAAGPPAAAAAAERKAELGRSTWTLLHMLAAQYPDRPTRGQRRDVAKLIDVLTRIYPCGECASHFAALVRASPPDTTSGPALRAWACEAHNAVNASLGKPAFNCRLVGARWAPLDCEEDGAEVGCALK